MTMPGSILSREKGETLISCENSQGMEIRASVIRLSRHVVVFEVYSPFPLLRLSEALNNFRILLAERPVYLGRAVVTNLVNGGPVAMCEATLGDSWLDIDLEAGQNGDSGLRA